MRLEAGGPEPGPRERRKRGIRKGLTALVVLAWLAATGLHLDLLVRGTLAWVPLYVTPGADGGPPVVSGFWPETEADAATPRVGDRLLRAGSQGLAGASRLGFLARAYREAEGGVVSFELERAGRRTAASLELRAFEAPWRQSVIVLGLGAGAAALWWRRRRSRPAAACALAMLAYSFHWAIFIPGGGWRTVAGFAVVVVSGSLFTPLALHAILEFRPPGRGPSLATRLWPWLFAVTGPLLSSWLLGVPLPGAVGLRLLLATYAAMIVALCLTLALTYRRADVSGRRQLRWVMLGFYLGLVPVAVTAGLAAVAPAYRTLYELSLLATLLIPFCIGVAVIHSNLFDIDRLLSSTAAYSLLMIVFLVLILVPVPAAAAAVGRLSGVDPAVVHAGLVVVLATAVIRGEQVVRPRVERVFFRERHTFESGVRELRASLSGSESPGALCEQLVARLAELLGLGSCALYVRAGASFAPLSSVGSAIPPGFDAEARLVTLLEDAERPVDVRRWQRWRDRGLISQLEAAQLESLEAQVLLPIRRGEELAGFLCLGGKRSEDVYTPVDLALLEGLCDRVSTEFERFDAAALERAEREHFEQLASYVPAAVRDQVAARPLEGATGEREVSVLFVDIRGYTALAESRSPDEIFRVVNAYTTAVSQVVREHGGWVVEFQGDGLMAVFGAPAAHEAKERAAAAAAFDVVAAVQQGIPGIEEMELTVGVGVATGPAYVGNVQSIDRRIWCVIGNTTNLAARLQAMTRDLGASIVIDDATHAAGGSEAGSFLPLEEVHVRGRSEPLRIFVAGGDAARAA